MDWDWLIVGCVAELVCLSLKKKEKKEERIRLFASLAGCIITHYPIIYCNLFLFTY